MLTRELLLDYLENPNCPYQIFWVAFFQNIQYNNTSNDPIPNNTPINELLEMKIEFPEGYIKNTFIEDNYTIEEIIPLETEINILKNHKYINRCVIVIDDLRIYKKGNYSKGDWENGREMLQNPQCFFLEDLNKTHIKIESEIEQGCVIFYPINSKVC
jgi:hypothetical protein